MDWITEIFTNTNSVAHIVLLYSIVIAIGVLLGKVKVGGISLGVTFVLFIGIIAGHIGFTGPIDILTFVQEHRPQGGYPRLPDAERRIRSMSRLSSRSFNASRLSPAFLPRQMPRLTFTRPFELK